MVLILTVLMISLNTPSTVMLNHNPSVRVKGTITSVKEVFNHSKPIFNSRSPKNMLL